MLVLSSSGDSASQYMNYMNAFFTAQVTISLFAFAELKDNFLFWIDANVHIVLVLKAGVSSVQYTNYMDAFFTAQVTISLFAFAELKDYLLFWIDANVHILCTSIKSRGVIGTLSTRRYIYEIREKTNFVHYSFSMSC